MAINIASIQNLLESQALDLDISSLVLAIVLTALLSYILGKLYIRFGTSISNRKRFASNFVLIATTTTLIISVVKSSLALSLGLVGALSIIRFRTAIKEPEELAFLFICISIGLGFGASQFVLTSISFVLLCALIVARGFSSKKEENQNLYLTISDKTSKETILKNVVGILNKYCSGVSMRRFDQTEGDAFEASFSVDIDSFENFEKIKSELKRLSKSMNISYLDKSGIS